jgi:DNA modification methylase
MKSLRRLVQTERQSKLKLGDALVEMIDEHNLRPVDLGRELKERPNHLSELYHVAKMFPSVVRQSHIPYTHYWMTMRCVRRFRSLKLEPLTTLKEIASLGLTQHRQVTAHFAAKQRSAECETSITRMSDSPAAGWLNRCINADCRSIVKSIPDESCKIVHADPPYACYRKVADGRYAGGSTSPIACDNKAGADAIKLTMDILRQWGSKLAPGGVLLLWQASGPLRKQIMSAVTRHGWEVEAVAIWDKGAIQPGNFTDPYSTQTEWLWVLKRTGDKLVNHDGSPRGDVLRFDPVHRMRGPGERDHAFEKPVDLCRFLVGKHSYPGEVVVDLCACTGSMGLAAADMGRPWLYVESNAENFRIGQARLNATGRKTAG